MKVKVMEPFSPGALVVINMVCYPVLRHNLPLTATVAALYYQSGRHSITTKGDLAVLVGCQVYEEGDHRDFYVHVLHPEHGELVARYHAKEPGAGPCRLYTPEAELV